MVAVLKTVVRRRTGGSNPSSSVNEPMSLDMVFLQQDPIINTAQKKSPAGIHPAGL